MGPARPYDKVFRGSRAAPLPTIDVEKREVLQILAGPQRHAGAAVDRFNIYDGVRILEIDAARRVPL